MNIAEIAKNIIINQNFTDYDIETYIDILKAADDLYYNDDESFLTDSEYDAIRRYAERINPSHVYFTGVGSEVRGNKVKLPYPMGSLDQIYEGEIGDWIDKNNLNEQQVIISDKLDGASAMVIYDKNGNLQIAYSRGNGIEGADIYRHFVKMGSVPKNVGKELVVRGEVIIEIASFPWLRTQIFNRAGKPYKNPRNMVSGLLNAKENDPLVYRFMRFVAYEIINGNGAKSEQLRQLDNLGFEVVESLGVYGKKLDDEFLTKHLTLRKQNSRYEIDGLVIDVDSDTKRKEMNPTRETLNPAYAIKYKVLDINNVANAKVIGVDWNISKHGYIKPRVRIEPVDLGGVTIEYATGFNAKFICDNKIGKGAIIEIVRSGDVIPFIQHVVESAEEPDLPNDINWTWTENENGEKVDIVINNPEDHDTVIVKRIVDFFEKIDAPMLKIGNVKKLFENGFDTVSKIIKAEKDDLVEILGENGKKIYDGLKEKLQDIELYKIIGAYSTQRGIGVRRMKMVQKALGSELLCECNDPTVIANINGFDEKTGKLVIDAINEFKDLYYEIKEYVTIAEDKQQSGILSGQKICMTGFRDKQLASLIEDLGGEVQSSVSGKTTMVIALNPNSNSSKIKKAKEKGIAVLSIDEFKEKVGL